jgi:hypothetical protein
MKRTIKQAEKECREAWSENPSTYGWCVHHSTEVERLTEPIENRINYILANKPRNEIVTRLDNLRPVLLIEAIASAQKACDKAVASAHRHDVPNHTWNGKDIF